MRYYAACLTFLALLLCFPASGMAHKVNVFAYVDGDAIQVACSFSKSRKVRYGKLRITDLRTGATVLEGTTDEVGLFRFRPDAAFLETGHGLNIRVNAGEGHQNDWAVSPEELAALSPSGQRPEQDSPAARPGRPAPAEQPVSSSLDAKQLEAMIDRVMDAKLAPIRQTLARQEDAGPALRDIIGGLGWIIGLLGMATYMRYRR
ncbi:MAG: hypothetical protein LIP28_02110 [Deltaproteobacteria bacterium]|nr:hypothetical protein [Deltaproteobacteria bacterium]